MGKVLSAQGTGYYPSCIPEGARPGSPLFLDLTIEQGMALYWRTRGWIVQASGTYYSDNRGTEQNPIIFSGGGSTTQVTPVGSEEELVCLGDRTHGFIGNIDDGTVDGGVELFLDYTFGFKTEEKFFPAFEFNSLFIRSRPATSVGVLRLIFNGYTIEKNLFSLEEDASGDVLIEFTCTQYWSYGGTYNTSTGEPL
jgi:hypothetical protein